MSLNYEKIGSNDLKNDVLVVRILELNVGEGIVVTNCSSMREIGDLFSEKIKLCNHNRLLDAVSQKKYKKDFEEIHDGIEELSQKMYQKASTVLDADEWDNVFSEMRQIKVRALARWGGNLPDVSEVCYSRTISDMDRTYTVVRQPDALSSR